MATRVHIRVRLLSNRVFVARFSTEIHHRGRQTEHHKFEFVIPTQTDCCSYGLIESSKSAGFYSVSFKSCKSQYDFFRDNSILLPIIRLDTPRNPNEINEFRARILNTKHIAVSKPVDGVWCCRDWVIHVLRIELQHNTFPRHKLELLIDHIQSDEVTQVCRAERVQINQPLVHQAVCIKKPVVE